MSSEIISYVLFVFGHFFYNFFSNIFYLLFQEISFLSFCVLYVFCFLRVFNSMSYLQNLKDLYSDCLKERHLGIKSPTRFYFIRKIFVRKWAWKTLKPQENVKKMSSLKCLSWYFSKRWFFLVLFQSYKIEYILAFFPI